MSGLPHGWVEVTLQDVAIWSSGGTPSRANPAYYEGEIPWFKTGELGPRVLYSAEEHISQAAVDASSAKLFPKGSVALAMYGATIGKTSIFGIDAATNQACAVGKPDAVSVEFLYYFLVSQEKSFGEAGKGGAQPNISQGIVKSWPFLLPPSAEQTRILEKLEELLTDLDAGVAELKAAQKKLVQYRQSLLKAAVEGALTAEWRVNNPPTETGAQLLERILQERRARWEAKQLAKFKEQDKAPPKDWQKKYPEPVQPDTTDLPELPQGWVWASVEQLSESVRNGLSKTPNTEQRGYPIFKINAVRPMAVNFTAIKHIEINENEAADYWVEVGDVLATRYNGSVDLLGVFGMVKNVPQRTLHPDKLIRMKPLTGAELGAWMEVCGNVGLSRKHLVARVKTTAGQTGISGEDLKRTPIPLPPVAEQKIALAVLEERLKAINELELPTELGLKQSTAQRQNILKAAFSGQLVPQDPSDEPASELLERIRAERAAQQAVKKPRGRKAKEAA